MNNVLNFKNFEIYNKIRIYVDNVNHNNDYAIITYRIYNPDSKYRDYTKKIPYYLINQAIAEFEYQIGRKLIYGSEYEIKKINRFGFKENNMIKKIIKITSLGVALSIIATSGYSLVKNSGIKNIKSQKNILYEMNNTIDDLSLLYLTLSKENKEILEKNYRDYQENYTLISSGNYNILNIENYLENVEYLLKKNIFIPTENFTNYHFMPYKLDDNRNIEKDDLYNGNSKKIVNNTNLYLKEQCRYLFYWVDDKTSDIEVRNFVPGTNIINKKIYFMPDNILDLDDSNELILDKIASLVQFKSVVIKNHYSYIDTNEKGVSKLFASESEIINAIDEKIDNFKILLKKRCNDLNNSKK